MLETLLPLLPDALQARARQLHEAHLAAVDESAEQPPASGDQQLWSLAVTGQVVTADRLGLYDPSAASPLTVWIAVAGLHVSAKDGAKWAMVWRVEAMLARLGPAMLEPLTVFLPLFPAWAAAGIIRSVDTATGTNALPRAFTDAVADCLLSAAATTRKSAHHLLARRGAEGELAIARLRTRVTPAETAQLDERLALVAARDAPLGTLDGVLNALERGDDADAVTELVTVWGSRRLRCIEPWILALCERAAPIDFSTRLGTEERERVWGVQWLAAPQMRGQLLQVPWPATWRHAQARVTAMLGGPDPRVPDALIALYGRYSSSAAYPFWRAVARALGEQGDARHVKAAARLAAERVPAGPVAFRELARGHPMSVNGATTVEPAEDLLLERIGQRVHRRCISANFGVPSKTDLESLLAGVHAEPDSDEARAVYADALSTVNDPRGEFIHLQLEIARRKAAAGTSGDAPIKIDAALERSASSLLNKFGDRWVDGVSEGLRKPGQIFHRGFLSGGVWGDVRETMTHPAWRLVNTITVSSGPISPLPRLYAAEPLPSIRALYGVEMHRIGNLLSTPYPEQLTHLGLYTWVNVLPQPQRFVRLREISLHHGGGPFYSEETTHAWPTVAVWIFRLAAASVGTLTSWRPPPNVTKLINTEGDLGPGLSGWTATFTRSTDGAMRCVQLRWCGGEGWRHEQLTPILRSLSAIESLVVHVPRSLPAGERNTAQAEITRLNGDWVE